MKDKKKNRPRLEADSFTQTIKIRIHPTEEQEKLLYEMMDAYRRACNFVSEYVFDNGCVLNTRKLHAALYGEIRRQFGLKAQLAVSVPKTVVSRYKTVREQMRQKPFRYPDTDDLDEDGNPRWKSIPRTLQWLWKPVHFSKPQVDLVRSRDWNFIDGGTKISMNTLKDRIKVTFDKVYFEGKIINLTEFLTDNKTWKFGTGKVVVKNKKWYFHVPVTKAVKKFQKEDFYQVVGIDRGMRFLAVTHGSDGRSFFYSGKRVIHVRHRYNTVRKELQHKNTHSAKQLLRKRSKRENRFMTDVNHSISKVLVRKYGSGTLFVIEDLVDITQDERTLGKSKSKEAKKKRNDKRSWAFYQLGQFIEYKAREKDSLLIEADAWKTSQRCPHCGRIRKANRKQSKHIYVCDKCGYTSNDDRLAAMNIEELGRMWLTNDVDVPSFKTVYPDLVESEKKKPSKAKVA